MTTPATQLDELTQSALDLWHHADPVEARRFDPQGPTASLVSFHKEVVRQHAAALRSLEGAVLELEIDDLDLEIDRTILLAALRPLIHRLDREHLERRNPVLWTDRLLATVVAHPGDGTALAALPAWVDDLIATLTKPHLAAAQVALDDLALVRTALTRAEWWLADKELLSAAVAALDRLDQFLRHDAVPVPNPVAIAMGEEAVSWHLHHAALLELGAREAERRLGGPTLGGPAALLQPADRERAFETIRNRLPPRGTLARRRILPPSWLKGFALFAAGQAPGADGVEWVAWGRRAGLLDLNVQLGTADLPAALETAARDGVAVLRHPLEAAMAALLALDWNRAAEAWIGPAEQFVPAILEQGILHPALASWRLAPA